MGRRKVDQDGGKQAEHNLGKGRKLVEENCEEQEVVDLAEVEVNEESVRWRKEVETQTEEEGAVSDPEQVRRAPEEEMNFMVRTLEMFDFGSWEEASRK